MKEKPILFSAPMVRAILDGRKTQTRRVVKKAIPDESFINAPYNGFAFVGQFNGGTYTVPFLCPYGQPGDRLWVRETWQTYKEFDRVRPNDISNQSEIQYPATYDGWDSRKRPSIHMPRWASRITLEITNVRVERLQDITDADALAEGVDQTNTSIGGYATERFKRLWQSINGQGSWAANPWVWVIEFKRIKP